MKEKQYVERIFEHVANEDLTSINKLLSSLDPAVRYNVIKECSKDKKFNSVIGVEKLKAVGKICTPDKPYQTYQDLKAEAINIYKHDNTTAAMIDVDRAVSRAYTILLTMISAINTTVNKQSEAINKIERVIGLELTNFDERGGNNGNDTGADDVQGNEDSY